MSNDPDSSRKSGCFSNLTALIAALGGGTGIIVLLSFLIQKNPYETSKSTPTSSFNSPRGTPSIQPPPNEPVSSECSNANITWGNLSQYFTVGRCELKPGYQQAESTLSFLVEAKGEFFGSMLVYFYDSDGVKICPNSVVGCSVLPYEKSVYFAAKQNSSFWNKGQRDRASISIPSNTSGIEFHFNQSQ